MSDRSTMVVKDRKPPGIKSQVRFSSGQGWGAQSKWDRGLHLVHTMLECSSYLSPLDGFGFEYQ